jgi:hypothetical protein
MEHWKPGLFFFGLLPPMLVTFEDFRELAPVVFTPGRPLMGPRVSASWI